LEIGKNASFERVAFSRQNWLEPMGQGTELQIDPDGLKHMEVQVTSKLLQLATLWRQLHTKLGPTETQHGKRSVIDSKTHQTTWKNNFAYSAGNVPSVELNLGQTCSQMGPI
jgi:hypothetical protein